MSRSHSTRAYRDLIVWQKALDLVPLVYDIAKKFPAEEQYGLTSQLQRAAVSVPANIAEGQAREAAKPFSNHLRIARGSLAEVDTLLLVAVRLGYIEENEVTELDARVIEIRRLLRGLISKLDGSS